MEQREPDEVGCTAVECTGTRAIGQSYRNRFPVPGVVRRVASCKPRIASDSRPLHPQWIKDFVLHELCEAPPAHLFNDVSEDSIPEVRVLIPLARCGDQIPVATNRLPERGREKRLVDVERLTVDGKPRRVTRKPADRSIVFNSHAGTYAVVTKVRVHRSFQRNKSLFHQNHEGRRGERLRDRRQSVQRLRGGGDALFAVRQAEPFFPADSALHHAHGHRRNLSTLDQPNDVFTDRVKLRWAPDSGR